MLKVSGLVGASAAAVAAAGASSAYESVGTTPQARAAARTSAVFFICDLRGLGGLKGGGRLRLTASTQVPCHAVEHPVGTLAPTGGRMTVISLGDGGGGSRTDAKAAPTNDACGASW